MTFLLFLLRYTIAKVRISWEHDCEEWVFTGYAIAVALVLLGWIFLPRQWLFTRVWESIIAAFAAFLVIGLVLAAISAFFRWLRDRYREWRAMGK